MNVRPNSTTTIQNPNPQQISSHGYKYGVKHFFSTESGSLGKIIASALSLPISEVDFLIELGAVYLNGVRVKNKPQSEPQPTVQIGDLLRVHTTPRRFDIHYDWKNLIVFDHVDFVILNKPPNIPSHPSVDNILENALTQTSLATQTDLLISHRLDSLTEGLIVYGKNKSFVRIFNQMLSDGLVEKHYVALTELGPDLLARGKKRLIHFMKPDPRAPKIVSDTQADQWLQCELEILDQHKHSSHAWQIELNLRTGRTHQIRAQLSFEGLPLLGDSMYGARSVYKKFDHAPEQLALRAQLIRFTYQDQQYQFELTKTF